MADIDYRAVREQINLGRQHRYEPSKLQCAFNAADLLGLILAPSLLQLPPNVLLDWIQLEYDWRRERNKVVRVRALADEWMAAAGPDSIDASEEDLAIAMCGHLLEGELEKD